MLAYRTLAVAGAGSAIGVAGGFLCALALLGSGALLKAAPADLALSALAALGGGMLVTGLALFVPGAPDDHAGRLDRRAQLEAADVVERRRRGDSPARR